MREIVFLILAAGILATLIWLSYKSPKARFPTMAVVFFFGLLAFYLFQYGNLSSFSIKGLSAEASFIAEKRQEVQQDAAAIGTIKTQVEGLLADSRASHEEIEKTKTEVLAIKKELVETTALASPPTLQLAGREIKASDSGYKITLQFTPSKNEPLGSIVFVATIDDNSQTRILDFWPSPLGAPSLTGDNSKAIEKDGRRGRLEFSQLSVGRPTFDLTVSGKARIKLEGNFLKDPVVLGPEWDVGGAAAP